MDYYCISDCCVDIDGDHTVGYQHDYHIAAPSGYAAAFRHNFESDDNDHDDFVFIEAIPIEIAVKQRIAYVPPRTWLLELQRLVDRGTSAELLEHYRALISMLKRVDKSRPVHVSLDPADGY